MDKVSEFAARISWMRDWTERRYVPIMKTSNFRVIPLQTEIAQAARRTAERGSPDHEVVIADAPTGFPCRYCLQWAKPGDRMVLFPFAAIPAGRPYSETGPIFVHAEPCERYSTTDEFPADFRKGRVIRAYDAGQNIIAAEVVNDSEPEAVIEKLFDKPETAFLHVRSASYGCYTMEIQRT